MWHVWGRRELVAKPKGKGTLRRQT